MVSTSSRPIQSRGPARLIDSLEARIGAELLRVLREFCAGPPALPSPGHLLLCKLPFLQTLLFVTVLYTEVFVSEMATCPCMPGRPVNAGNFRSITGSPTSRLACEQAGWPAAQTGWPAAQTGLPSRCSDPGSRAATPSDDTGSRCTAANAKIQVEPKERTNLDDLRHERARLLIRGLPAGVACGWKCGWPPPNPP
jgi:hypothetical protein